MCQPLPLRHMVKPGSIDVALVSQPPGLLPPLATWIGVAINDSSLYLTLAHHGKFNDTDKVKSRKL